MPLGYSIRKLPMRRLAFAAFAIFALAGQSLAQPAPPEPAGKKPNADPCSDEVAAALQKLRKSSWFRMDTRMITENGPTTMQVDYVLPDRMHQKVTMEVTQKTSELILVGDTAWARQEDGGWKALPAPAAAQLKGQMQENVVQQQTDIGSYACKGRTQFEGHDVLSYKLDSEPEKGSTAQASQAFRMFYVDALTGLPVSNALLVPGHEQKPIFKTTYSFPLDMKIEPPKDVPAAAPAAPPAPMPDGK
jgi:hypothetical protein